jgi:UDP-glucose 4-epimerase
VNRDVTLVLARMVAEVDVKRFVSLISIKVNGEMISTSHSFTPEDLHVSDDPYCLSKYEAEQGLLVLAKETGMEVVIICPHWYMGQE